MSSHTLPDTALLAPLPEEQQPYGVEIKMADGIFVKQMVLSRAGTVVPQHAHEYEHLSMLAVGTIRLFKDGVAAGEFSAPCGITIAARVKHTMVALSNRVVIYCIHNIERSGEVDIHAEHQLELPRLHPVLAQYLQPGEA